MTASVLPNTEELAHNKLCLEAMKRLKKLGVRDCKMVYEYWPALESDWPGDTAIYVDMKKAPMTALMGESMVTVVHGWYSPSQP